MSDGDLTSLTTEAEWLGIDVLAPWWELIHDYVWNEDE